MVDAHGVLEVQEGALPSRLGMWVRRGLRRLLRVMLELVRLRTRTELSKMFRAKLKGENHLMGCGAEGTYGSMEGAAMEVWRNQRGLGGRGKMALEMMRKTSVFSSILKQATAQTLYWYRT